MQLTKFNAVIFLGVGQARVGRVAGTPCTGKGLGMHVSTYLLVAETVVLERQQERRVPPFPPYISLGLSTPEERHV